MQSKALTVDQYVKELPADRRAVISAVRQVFLKNLNKGFEERMSYGMIGYCVPHSIYPAGYHCDPKQPLPFAGIAAQKNAYSVYLFCIYADADEGIASDLTEAFGDPLLSSHGVGPHELRELAQSQPALAKAVIAL